MGRLILVFYLGWLGGILLAAEAEHLAPPSSPPVQLTPDETAEIQARLRNFYAVPVKPEAMNIRQPKYDVATGQPSSSWTLLRPAASAQPGTLAWLAGEKGTEAFQKAYCDQVLKKRFPNLNCDHSQPPTWAAGESNDRMENLVHGWVAQPTYDLDSLPTDGSTDIGLWSDDYWPIQFGGTSFRYGKYSSTQPFANYRQAVGSYFQPKEWGGILPLPLSTLDQDIWSWSPAEKYDLTVGDELFSLTNEQKQEGSHLLNDKGDVDSWMGYCNGWTAASVMVAKPTAPVTLVGPMGTRIQYSPADVRALATLTWAKGDYNSQNVGGRCDEKDPKTYPNGRLVDQDCFDTNPATFHLALANMIGLAHQSFIMDKQFDYQVWNQPIQGYSFTYFNPLQPSMTSKNWRDVVVPYDQTFKSSDRFQHPLTRGVRTAVGYSDRNVQWIVGVIATVDYLAEVQPDLSTSAGQDLVRRESYTYDLELYPYNGGVYPQGGEWHENAHPDFLWVPAHGDYAHFNSDFVHRGFTGKTPPSYSLTRAARQVSSKGATLCEVMRSLVDASSGQARYQCP